ncbi:LOW QUALITY PROTEIN: 5-FCL-like protein [Geomicrobium sp. JCM 19037]|nr:LOW QUALITY PROTEIN: 5-FCL-like protein [Geomicrobium sp. JCM 19037]
MCKLKEKQQIREEVWEELTRTKSGRFPFPLHGRIPNFKGAERAAEQLFQLDIYKKASVVKVNPDSPQLPIRARVIADQKTLLVPTPRLKDGFIIVRPGSVPAGGERKAASLKHINAYGEVIPLHELPAIDLMLMGSVAVDHNGHRIGKGLGFADREYGIIRELGNKPVPVVTTIHHLQLIDDTLPSETFDVPVDWIITEEKALHLPEQVKPSGIEWSSISDDDYVNMPVLQELKQLLKNKNEQSDHT